MISEVYNMDCMEYMKSIPDKFFDLAVVDPPYFPEANLHYHNGSNISSNGIRRTNYKKSNAWDVPTRHYYNELVRISKNQIIWGINYYSFIDQAPCGRIVWDKQRAGLIKSFSDAEIASCSIGKGVRIFRYRWDGMLQGNMKNKEKKIHITQKPVALYAWIFNNYAKPGDKILDTHLGSGSSRIAAYKMGFDFYATEIDKDYFQAQEKRFKEECLGEIDTPKGCLKQMNLFE